MSITENQVVEIEFTLKDNSGKVLDSSENGGPLAYLHGHKNLIPGLEAELEGKAVGDEVSVTIEPKDGYGEVNPDLVNDVPKQELASIPDLQVGVQLQADTPEGTVIYTVVEVNDDTVKLDGNHPLAGMTLNFEVKVTSVREATAEELDHGHVHGPGGHQH